MSTIDSGVSVILYENQVVRLLHICGHVSTLWRCGLSNHDPDTKLRAHIRPANVSRMPTRTTTVAIKCLIAFFPSAINSSRPCVSVSFQTRYTTEICGEYMTHHQSFLTKFTRKDIGSPSIPGKKRRAWKGNGIGKTLPSDLV